MAGEGVVDAARGERAGFAEVVSLAGDHVPDAPTRIVHVAAVAGNHVDVEVHDGLARGLASVEADVVAVGLVGLVEFRFRLVDELEDRALFFGGGVEPGRDEAARDDEGVAFGDGVLVVHGEGERVGCDPRFAGYLEEGAGHEV